MASLNYDSQGFIIGIGRIEKNTKLLQDDTTEIIRILLGQRQADNQHFSQMQRSIETANQKYSRGNRQNKANSRTHRNNRIAPASAGANDRTMPTVRSRINPSQNTTGTDTNNRSIAVNSRLRDTNGRFSRQQSQNAEAEKAAKKIVEPVEKEAKHLGEIDTENLDPVMDSMREAKTLFTPVTKSASMVWGAGVWAKQQLAERRQEKHDDTVEDRLHSIAGNTGGGRVGGRFGKFAKMGMMGAAGLGVAGLMMNNAKADDDMDDEGLDDNEQGEPQADTDIKAPDTTKSPSKSEPKDNQRIQNAAIKKMPGEVGDATSGFLNSKGESIATKSTAPHLQNWSNSLKNENLPGKMNDTFTSNTTSFFGEVGNIWKWVKDKASGIMGTGTSPSSQTNGGQWSGGGGQMNGSGAGGSWGGGGNWKVDFGNALTRTKDGITYKMGAKGLGGLTIDCSGWVDALNRDVSNQVKGQLGEAAARNVRINASGGAAGIIQTETQKGRLVAEAGGMQDLDPNQLQAGMIIGQSRGSHAKSRYKGIGHIVSIIEENGVKYVSESTSAKGADGQSGVNKTELGQYVKNLKGRRFGVSVVDPYKNYRNQLSGDKSDVKSGKDNKSSASGNTKKVNMVDTASKSAKNPAIRKAVPKIVSSNNDDDSDDDDDETPPNKIRPAITQTAVKTTSLPKSAKIKIPPTPNVDDDGGPTKKKSINVQASANKQPEYRGIAHAVTEISTTEYRV